MFTQDIYVGAHAYSVPTVYAMLDRGVCVLMQEYVLAYKLHTDSQRLETKFQSLDKQIVQAANGPGMVQPHENYFKDEFVRQQLSK